MITALVVLLIIVIAVVVRAGERKIERGPEFGVVHARHTAHRRAGHAPDHPRAGRELYVRPCHPVANQPITSLFASYWYTYKKYFTLGPQRSVRDQ